MADNRNYDQQSYNQDWDQNKDRFDQQDQQRNRQQNVSYGDQLKGGYGGSEYGNTYYRADYNNQSQRRVNYMPDNDENRDYHNRYNSSQGNQHHQDRQGGYGNQGANYGGGSYGNDFNVGGYGRVGNTGGSFNDSGWSNNRRNFDHQEGYGQRGNHYGHEQNRQYESNDRNWFDRASDKVSSWFEGDNNRNGNDRRTTGEHRGKGPRGYQRSADRIREDICDRLSDDPFVDASDIEVQIEGNNVVLAGTVDSKDAKRRAEDLVESISGVKNVENRIRVDRDRMANHGTRHYTSTDDVGDASGTTREIIRDQNAANKKQ